MPETARLFPSLATLAELVPEFTYVMCGARGETSHRLAALPRVRFVGFEPDPAECEALRRNAAPGHTYHPFAVAGRNETRTLYVTRNPACSSLLPPNHEFFSQFTDCGPQMEVVGQRQVETVSLNDFLPRAGISGIDFLALDTQGIELEILRGADHYLPGILGVQTEVEFSPLYHGQPLFAEVDGFLRAAGFMLFDVSRTRYRRGSIPRDVVTRGQLLWGDALYLRDFRTLTGIGDHLKFCLTSAVLGFPDYAVATMDFILENSKCAPAERARVSETREQYVSELRRHSRLTRVAAGLHGLKAGRGWKRRSDFAWTD